MDKNFKISGSTLTFNTIYDDYGTFINETKDPIYRTILLAFKDLKEKEETSVNVVANINNTEFESVLVFDKSKLDMLTTIINPFFEEQEDYETCAEVMKIFSDLVS